MVTSGPLSLGVEEELHLIDLTTFRLAGRARALLAQLPEDKFASELQRTTVETNTAVCKTLSDLRAEMVALRGQVVDVASREGLGIAAVGTVPMSSADDFELTSSGRFARMQEDYRLLVDEQLICGLQVHVGVPDRDLAVLVAQRISRDLPPLLALSASSPMWHGSDTGYSSMRSIIWQRWPTAGMTGRLSSAAEYDQLLSDLIRSGVITDKKMAYFDVRPSAHVPTLELRVCDATPIVDDAVAIAGLFRALVAEAIDAARSDAPFDDIALPMHRAAMWRAARSGLGGQLLDTRGRPRPKPAATVVRAMRDRLRPYLEDTDDWQTVSELIDATIARGNSADRQRAALAERGRLSDVVLRVVSETQNTAHTEGAPQAREGDYAWTPGDEAFTDGTAVRPMYRDVFAAAKTIGTPLLRERLDERDRWASGAGMTFGVEGKQQPFQVDLVPRIIAAHEWAELKRGLLQRARTIELFLRDVYGPGEVVRDGVLPASTVYDSPGWRDEGRLLPRGSVRAAVFGFDLVKDESAGWRVLEDNVRVPSGAGYAIASRQLMDAVMPDVPRPGELQPAHTAPGLLRSTLAACSSVSEPVIALLSDGPQNSAWFEHRMLAERAGFILATPTDLDVIHGAVRARGRRIDVIYLRLDVELPLLEVDGRRIGAEIMQAAGWGAVAIANAPGNGVADDKSMYVWIPDLIAYYLGERPLLDPVPTYRCGDDDERASVLDRLGQLVTKPVDGYGGGGVLIGPMASKQEIEARRAEIGEDPARWIAQEVVNLSTHPTMTGDGFAPRHVDLRAFVYLHGTGADEAAVADLGLTRVAAEGSMVVNSSRGGGAKDTWILGPTPDSF